MVKLRGSPSTGRHAGSNRPLTFPQCLLQAEKQCDSPASELYFQEQEEALKDMARFGIDVINSDNSENEGSNNAIATLKTDEINVDRKLVKSSSSYENLYDLANLEVATSDDTPPIAQLTETLGEPTSKTLLPPEMCSSFENIYMETKEDFVLHPENQ